MLAFTYQQINDKINLIKISQGSDYEKAILMMTFGSPEEITFEGVADFFTNIRRGVRPQDHEVQTLYDNYVLIGGTPLQRITREEVALVEARLGNEYSVYFANKFSRPLSQM